MLYYHHRFPDNLSAIQMYVAEANSDLPEGIYAFLEAYCPNPECTCRKVEIEIVKQTKPNLGYFETSEQPTATLEYDWESPLSEQNPCFPDEAYQSEWSHAARQVFVDYVQADPGYNKELARRFLKMKMSPDLESNKDENRYEPVVRKTPKLGRNDPCFCGSGKKYKKCCIEK